MSEKKENFEELTEIDISSLKTKMTRELCNYCLNVKAQFGCPNYLTCPYQNKCKANVVVNEYLHTKEILIFKDAFWQRDTMGLNTNVDRTRKWMYDNNGILIQKNEEEELSIFKLKNVLIDSRKRSLQNLYGYIRSNTWKYFLTLTIEKSSKYDKYNDEDVEYIWQLFRQKMQYRFKNIKMIAVTELHKKGGIHFHGFIGNCNLDKYLTVAINSAEFYVRKGKKVENKYYMQPLKTNFGDQVYNLDTTIYDKGFVTIVKISGEENELKLANYVSKYLAKDRAKVKYNKKIYWRTYNLDFYNKEVSFLNEEEKTQIVSEISLLNCIRIKESKKFVCYTIKK